MISKRRGNRWLSRLLIFYPNTHSLTKAAHFPKIVMMPRKNGKEVYEEIIKIKPDLKALFISGYAADIIHRQGIIDEGINFISKPVLPEALLRIVREVLDQ